MKYPQYLDRDGSQAYVVPANAKIDGDLVGEEAEAERPEADSGECKPAPLPHNFVLSMLEKLGRSMKRLSKDDREMAQRIAASALMELKEYKPIFVDPFFAETWAPPLGEMELPNDAPCEPLKALLPRSSNSFFWEFE